MTPFIQNIGHLIGKQVQLEKMQSINAEAERALELIRRAIRMAGYRHQKSFTQDASIEKSLESFVQIHKNTGYQQSDALMVKYELSDGVDFDCTGNVLSTERTKHGFAQQGFMVDRQTQQVKGTRTNGGSLNLSVTR